MVEHTRAVESSGRRDGDAPFETHEVFNQSPTFVDENLYATDKVLREAVSREGGPEAQQGLQAWGALCGSAEMLDLGRLANACGPVLRTHDAKGRRIDLVEFHPAYHELMRRSMAEGLHCSTWEAAAGPSAHVARAAKLYLTAQAESGHICPVTMTHAAVAALRHAPGLLREWLPKILTRRYDPVPKPLAEKQGVTLGMGMTEKQGGTDVRANTTRAEPAGGAYAVTGHKWFMSAPMCDGFLVLAQAPDGLGCFLMPRVLPDGTVNGLRFMRLKDKLGNRSNASSEVEFARALAWPVGEEGRGVRTILEMVTLTRLDCAVSSAGLMRLGLANAVLHARHRSVFQRRLVDQPVMANVLADLALEVEAATALAFRLARAFDRAGEEAEADFARLMTPAVKYWACKTAPAALAEAMECLGGNGYVEEGLLARAYREAPLNAIWEGSGNVMALDVLRALSRRPEALGSVLDEALALAGSDPRIAAEADALADAFQDGGAEFRARELTERLALLVAAALLAAHAPDWVSEPFRATRLDGGWRATYGRLPASTGFRDILDRAFPA